MKGAATAVGRYRAPAAPASLTAPSGQYSGIYAEGDAQAPPSGPQARAAPLSATELAAARPRVGSGGGELDFARASRCPSANEANGKPVGGLPPEVLDVIAVAAEIALRQRHPRQAA